MAELLSQSLLEAVDGLQRGEFSAVELTESCLARIAALNPKISAFIHAEPEAALRAARAADRRLGKRGAKPWHLDGIPLARKDLFDRAGQHATCASLLRKDHVASATAACLLNLDSAGAVDLGGLNMSEFALDVHGRNRMIGLARNPWDPSRTAGGSSGGSAAAVSAGMVFGALGSDTGGSIRYPAALCGVVGLVPTPGLVSRQGMFSACPSLDTPGPIARSVEDCARFLSILACSPTAMRPDYEEQLAFSIRGRRIGVPDAALNDVTDDVAHAIHGAVDVCRDLGAIISNVALPDIGALSALASIVLGSETASAHRSTLRTRAADYTPAVLDRLLLGLTYDTGDYARALNLRGTATHSFCRSVFSSVDALLLPTAPTAAPTLAAATADEQFADPGQFTRFTNYLGLPALAIPCGESTGGLPLGMQLVGRPYSERRLLNLGAAYQSTTAFHRRKPKL